MGLPLGWRDGPDTGPGRRLVRRRSCARAAALHGPASCEPARAGNARGAAEAAPRADSRPGSAPYVPCSAAGACALAVAARAAAASAAAAAVVAARLAGLARRGVLRPLDELLRRDELAVLVLLRRASGRSGRGPCRPPARPRRATSPRAITSSMWLTRPGPTFETWSSPSVPFFSSTNAPKSVVFTTLPVNSSPTSGSLVSAVIAAIAASPFVALGRVDEDRAVLLDVDLHLVVGLERADRLAALADHHADVLGVDLDGRDPRRVARRARVRGSPIACEHPVEDRDARLLRLLRAPAP